MKIAILVCVSTSVVYLLIHVYELYRPVLPVSRVAADQEELAMVLKRNTYLYYTGNNKKNYFISHPCSSPPPSPAGSPS